MLFWIRRPFKTSMVQHRPTHSIPQLWLARCNRAPWSLARAGTQRPWRLAPWPWPLWPPTVAAVAQAARSVPAAQAPPPHPICSRVSRAICFLRLPAKQRLHAFCSRLSFHPPAQKSPVHARAAKPIGSKSSSTAPSPKPALPGSMHVVTVLTRWPTKTYTTM